MALAAMAVFRVKDRKRWDKRKHRGGIDLEHPFNLGKGAALRTGFQYILEKGYELVITLDADGQHDPSEIPLLLEVFQNVEPDILIASLYIALGEGWIWDC
jgi:glycosyltransferase involved in cell wall biosynthesis